jgi:lysophospholipase L1-like esterase
MTSIHRNQWNGSEIADSHGDYPPAVRELAKELDVPLIDLHAETEKLFEMLGPEKTKEIFLILEPGESPNYPDGVEDNTHLQEEGARIIAEMVAAQLKKLDLPISEFVTID